MIFNYLKKKWTRKKIYKELGNPGIAWYVKKECYDSALRYLDEREQFHDLKRTGGEIWEFPYKDFQYRHEITHCDFSKENLKEDDTIIMIWVVDKALKKK